MNTTTKMEAVLKGLNIGFTNVTVLGRFVHIDTFAKYEQAIYAAFNKAGGKCITLKGDANGEHMDGSKAFRVVVKL